MKKWLLFACLAGAFPIACFASPTLAPAGLDALQGMIDGAIANHRMTAAIAAIELDGKVAWQYTAGENAVLNEYEERVYQALK